MSQWYFQNRHGLPDGPHTDVVIREFREAGTVRDTTLIWRTGWKEWTTFADLWKSDAPESEPHEAMVLDCQPPAASDGPPPLPFRLAAPIFEVPLITPKYSKCSICRESWAEHLLFGAGRLQICAKCLRAHEQKRQAGQSRSLEVGGGIGSWLFKLLLVGAALAGIVIFSLSAIKGTASQSLAPKPASPAGTK
jgi:hypothetical protein